MNKDDCLNSKPSNSQAAERRMTKNSRKAAIWRRREEREGIVAAKGEPSDRVESIRVWNDMGERFRASSKEYINTRMKMKMADFICPPKLIERATKTRGENRILYMKTSLSESENIKAGDAPPHSAECFDQILYICCWNIQTGRHKAVDEMRI